MWIKGAHSSLAPILDEMPVEERKSKSRVADGELEQEEPKRVERKFG